MDGGILVYYKELFTLAMSAAITTFVGLWVKRMFRQRDKKDAEIQALLKDREDQKEKAIAEWRATYTQSLATVRDTQTKIIDLINKKVNYADYNRAIEKLEELIHALERR